MRGYDQWKQYFADLAFIAGIIGVFAVCLFADRIFIFLVEALT